MKKKHILYLVLFVLMIGGGLGIVYKKMNKIPQITIVSVNEDSSIKNKKIDIMNSKKTMHMSFDDVIDSFEDVANNNYDSIFQNDFFSFLEDIHNKYGAVFSLFVFYENDDQTFNLTKMPDKYAKEFEDNSHWLKFGFHSLNREKNYTKTQMKEAENDYNLVIDELVRITGSENSIDRVPRLHNFAANKESVEGLKKSKLGITGLLGPDDKRLAYDLDKDQTSYLYLYDFFNINKLNYFKTNMRLENIDNVNDEFRNYESGLEFDDRTILVVFTHEYLLKDDSDIKDKIETIFELTSQNDYLYDYLK